MSSAAWIVFAGLSLALGAVGLLAFRAVRGREQAVRALEKGALAVAASERKEAEESLTELEAEAEAEAEAAGEEAARTAADEVEDLAAGSVRERAEALAGLIGAEVEDA